MVNTLCVCVCVCVCVLCVCVCACVRAGLHTEGGDTGISPLQLEFPPELGKNMH